MAQNDSLVRMSDETLTEMGALVDTYKEFYDGYKQMVETIKDLKDLTGNALIGAIDALDAATPDIDHAGETLIETMKHVMIEKNEVNELVNEVKIDY